MLCAYGQSYQETPAENSIIFTADFNFCAKKINTPKLDINNALQRQDDQTGTLVPVNIPR
jgi:hypothetical protein